MSGYVCVGCWFGVTADEALIPTAGVRRCVCVRCWVAAGDAERRAALARRVTEEAEP